MAGTAEKVRQSRRIAVAVVTSLLVAAGVSCTGMQRINGEYALEYVRMNGAVISLEMLEESGMDTQRYYLKVGDDEIVRSFGGEEEECAYTQEGKKLRLEGDATSYTCRDGRIVVKSQEVEWVFQRGVTERR